MLDQAGWHKSGDLVIPQGLHLLFLPSHSPELQPAERLWPLSNEPLANRVFNSLDELQEVQIARCRWLQAHRCRSFVGGPPFIGGLLYALLKRI